MKQLLFMVALLAKAQPATAHALPSRSFNARTTLTSFAGKDNSHSASSHAHLAHAETRVGTSTPQLNDIPSRPITTDVTVISIEEMGVR